MRKIIFLSLIILISMNLAASFKDEIPEFFKKSGIPKEVAVIAISAIPIFELRLGLPLAVQVFKMDLQRAFLYSFIGNLIPVLPILLFLSWIYSILEKLKLTKRAVEKFKKRTEEKSIKIGKYEMMGLIIFIGFPLPGTGAWTGSAVAVALSMDIKRAFIANVLGIIMAGIIVLVFTMLGLWGAILAGFILAGMAVLSILRARV